MSRHTRITKAGWLYLGALGFVLSGAVLREINLLLLLAGVLVGVAVWSWTTRRWLQRLAARRVLPPTACVGDDVAVTIELASRRRLSSWAVAVDDVVRRISTLGTSPIATGRVFFPFVPARQTTTAAYRLRPLSRGRYAFGPLATLTRFPLGLLVHWAWEQSTETLLVGPRLGRLTRAWRLIEQEDAAGAQPLARRHARSDGDFYGLRDWRDGDGRRRIHWRTSARRGRLVVRQFEAHTNTDLAIELDLWQPSEPTDADLRRVELAVSFAATLAADACRRGGARLSLVVAGAEPRQCQGWASSVLLDEVIAALAVAEACSTGAIEQFAGDDRAASARHIAISTRSSVGDGPLSSGERASASAATAVAGRTRVIHVDSPQLALWFEAPPWPSAQ